MMHIFTITLFLISILAAPVWISVALAVLLLSEWGDYALVVLAGACMDLMFGAPIALFGGFAFVYTGIFTILAVASLYLRATILE